MTTNDSLEALKYPVGPFRAGPAPDPAERDEMIRELAAFPGIFRAAVSDLTDAQLDTPYRPGGWTVRQLVHHVPDSHLNCYIRFKLAVTEETPTIRPYDQAAWAETADGRDAPPGMSLDLLTAVHRRWIRFLHGLPESAWSRTLLHPEMGTLTLDDLLQHYVWHSRHHLAHVTGLRERQGWNG